MQKFFTLRFDTKFQYFALIGKKCITEFSYIFHFQKPEFRLALNQIFNSKSPANSIYLVRKYQDNQHHVGGGGVREGVKL